MTTTRLAPAIALLLLITTRALAQEPAPPASPDYSREPYVVEQSLTTWRYESDGTGRREIAMRVRVQSDAGVEAWGQLVFPYNAVNERLDVVYVRVTKPDGTVVTAAADAVQDLSSAVQRVAPVYTDTREKHITVPGLRPGERLELALAIAVHTPLARGHFWGDHEFARHGIVLDERLQLDVPIDRTVNVKTRSDVEAPSIKERGGRRIYEWHTARLANDDDAKDKNAKPNKKEPEQPAVRMTTFASWKELGTWYRELEKPQRAPAPEIRRKAAELTAGKATDRDKLFALYQYVATSFRYVSLSFGVGRYQPHAAAEVLQHQYGDCKDKHTLLASLAQSIGLRASAVLIHSSIKLDPDVPSPSQFDHVMTRVALPNGDVWLDTTAEVAPFGLLAPPLRHKQALVVDPTAASQLAETPAAAPVPTATAVRIEGVVSDTGTLSAKVHLAFSGDIEYLMRVLLRRTPSADWKRFFNQLSSREMGESVELEHLVATDPSALDKPFTVDFDVANAEFVAPAKKDVEVPFPFSEFTSARALDPIDADDESEIELGSDLEMRYALTLQLPENLTARAPIAVALTRDYSEYRADYRLDGRTFAMERALVIKGLTLPATRRRDVASFARAVGNDLKQTLVVDSRLAADPAAGAKVKVEDLYKSGSDALDQGGYRQAILQLKKVVDLDPSYKTAWTKLGRAYMGLKQTDDAIAAFQKQIEVNAYARNAYNNLGWAYRDEQKFREAETAFRRTLEIDPLDEYAHENLGGLYLDQHQYAAAAPELEKAVALAPKNAMYRVNLGKALLNVGRREEALAAFAKAVELDPAPLTLNDIAYELAQHATDLDVAQRYAESAVASTAAASRTIAADRVTERDLYHIRELGSYWDTLGWVYFAKGDLDRAERLVRAAWMLMQNGEIGDHLGQLYEKRGRKADTIDAYALAMKGEKPDNRTRDRLAAIAGGADRADALAEQRASQLARERTIALDCQAPKAADADFFIVFDNKSGEAVVEGVAFASGDKALQPLSDAVRRAKYDVRFPDATPAKLVRRATVSCRADGAACELVLARPAHAFAEEK
jgi:tetratricopeptide (TPR) repeat protein